MGNKTGITWVWKTKEQKESDIQKYFINSEIRILENKIIRTIEHLKECRGEIGRLKEPCFQEKILDTKSKIESFKEKVKQLQIQVAKAKGAKSKRKRRKKEKQIKKYQEWLNSLLTRKEMIDIIKNGE